MSGISLICIDPGHGGRLPGAEGGISVEKVLNLELAKILRDLLAHDYEVVMTREGDIDLAPGVDDRDAILGVDLDERCRICNDADADLFVSIHYNASDSPKGNGFEVLHWHKSAYGERLAKLILEEFDRIGDVFGVRNRGLKPRDDVHVLEHTRPPAVLVEAGFISNPSEERVVTIPDYQYAVAESIAAAISRYKT